MVKGRQMGLGAIGGELGSFPWLWDTRNLIRTGRREPHMPGRYCSFILPSALLVAPSRWNIPRTLKGPLF